MSNTERVTNAAISTALIGVSTKVPLAGSTISLGMLVFNTGIILSNSQLSRLEKTADMGRLIG